jgi:AcrR family transcriptional regulator
MEEPMSDQGLRERKKQRTRELIAETARRLFLERGFDAVSVAEIAREADVAEKTVFNYFPTKEDLFYSRLESFEEELLDAISRRKPGESVVAAFGRFVLEPRGLLATRTGSDAQEAAEALEAITEVITESPALLAREQQVFARYTDSLAGLIAEETGAAADDIEPWVVANALMGIHRALIDHVRRRVLAGRVGRARLAREVRMQGEAALARLERGLGRYAPKRR